jgi:UDP-N-acetylglucosamine 1-carboxyvinyltransferase
MASSSGTAPGIVSVRGGVPLSGTVWVDGSKNAALPLLAAAAALPVSAVELAGIPACADVSTMTGLLRAAGWPVSSQRDDRGRVCVGGLMARGRYPDLAAAAAIRASYYLVAPLIAGYGRATLPWPGGCRVGDRGMDPRC